MDLRLERTLGQSRRHMPSAPSEDGTSSALVSVLIITWNRREDVLGAVHSVYEQDYRSIEIIVVDNGSTDGTLVAIGEAFPEVKTIRLEGNLGVSVARNLGIEAASGEIVFCLDSDAQLGTHTLSAVVHRFEIQPQAGIINSRILDPHTKELASGPGWVYSDRQRAHQNEVFASWSFSEGGAAIRREVVEKVGPFWERLYFGCEGQDLSLRALDAGFITIYDPDSVVYHKMSHRSRIDGARRERFSLESTLSIYLVRYPWWMFLLLAPLRIGAVMIRAIRRGYTRAFMAGLRQIALSAPQLLRERRAIRWETAINYLHLQMKHGPLSWDLASWIRNKT